jgi:CDP-diacylglycerol--serine O-phosphatidyltransferase
VTLLGERRPSIADLLTLGNAVCGATAVLVVAGALGEHDPPATLRLVAFLLLAGTVLDVVDGAAARLWGSTPMGGPLDCLADGISFGLAPALALGSVGLHDTQGGVWVAVLVGVLVYFSAALVRLAAFMAQGHRQSTFTGLPTTSACVCTLALGFVTTEPGVIALGLLVFGVLMMSAVRYPVPQGGWAAVAVTGWGLGLLGLLGILDLRFLGATILLVILVMVPAATAMRRTPDKVAL